MSTPLQIPFRKSAPLTPPLSTAITSYISSKYDQHPDMFKADLAMIDKLRSDAVNVREAHGSGLVKLGAYAAVLSAASGKFPVDIGADFSWYPALGYYTQRPITQNNLQFERANVIYNIASLYSQLAVSVSHSTSEGLRQASNYFSWAAGTLSHLRTEIIPKMRSLPPDDMDVMTLEALENLMLAQGQECYWKRAVMDGMKDSNISKLAAKVNDFYAEARDVAKQSDAISTDWIHHMTAKHHHFAAAAQLRASCDALEKARYGEEVARLQDALKCVNEGLREESYVSSVVTTDLKGLKQKIVDTLRRAEKDNDLIYLAPVPSKAELAVLRRAQMVNPVVPKEITEASAKLVAGGEYGPPLFQNLVPFAVHMAGSIYVERRDRAVNNIIEELEILTVQLRETLQSLNLPGSLEALEKPLGLPPGLMAHVQEVRQAGGVEGLLRAYDDVTKIKSNDKAVYQECVEILRLEEEEDQKMRQRHGTDRWLRKPSKEVESNPIKQVEEYGSMIQSADNSDRLIMEKIRMYEAPLRLMQGSDSGLREFVPNSSRPRMNVQVDKISAKLRQLLDETSRFESARKRLIEQIRERGKADDITQALLAEAAKIELEQPLKPIEAADFETLFAERLRAYDEYQSLKDDEQQKQKSLVTKIKEANTTFVSSRKVDDSLKEREQALQTLETAYSKYQEVIGNLEAGRTFYNNLAKLLARLQQEAKGFVYARKYEAEQMEMDITSAMSNLRISSTPATAPIAQYQQPPQQQPVLPPQPQAPAASSRYPTRSLPTRQSETATPLPAPQAQRPLNVPSVPTVQGGIWTPDQGIRFGPPAGGSGRGR
ncbi:pH-response regulator protein palA/rim20 [Orbilia blumenaviensis]|uniref:PH-response regulator protein palA/rim20 n=1 Tax=Orbilia blumenaviensis TaxID=1796055 RepID=A0AAV9U301_9PEZI